MNKELLINLKTRLKEFGFFECKDMNYGKNFLMKVGKYSFQVAVIRIVILENNKFYIELSFDFRLSDGLAFYIEPWRKDGNEQYIYYTSTSCNHVYIINDNRIYNKNDYSAWALHDNEFFDIDIFMKLFTYEGLKLVDKYLIPQNNINYLLEEFKKEKTISKAFSLALLYEQLGNKEETIVFLKECLSPYNEEYINNRYLSYIAFLENDTPLPYIPSPADKASLFQLIGNDIYIALNKKTIKDNEILEYFGSKDIFDKPQKVSYEELNNDSGIVICKVGKWSILRIGLDVFMQFDQIKIENMLSDMSAKYNRAILLVNQDTTNTFGFEVYKKGEFLRRWMAGDGEVLENIGKPITGEKKRFLDILKKEQDVQSVVEFLDDILKITHGDLEKSKTVFYEIK